MTAEHQGNGATWATMSKRQRLALLGESLNSVERVSIMARVEKHFRGQRGARLDDFFYATNVMLRETWRERHGNTDAWDRSAAAALAAGQVRLEAVPR